MKDKLKTYLSESDVHQGDLIYLRHKEKPYKSGWWRKIRAEDYKSGMEDSGVYYVLEIPTHNDFYKNQKDGSKKILDTYVMGKRGFRLNEGRKYEILCILKGVKSIQLPYSMKDKKQSLVPITDLNDTRSLYTKNYMQMADIYFQEKEKVNVYEQLALELQ